METREFYDKLARAREFISNGTPVAKEISVYERQFKLLLHRLIDFYIKDAVVIDIGCGDGGDISPFHGKFRMAVGLDLSEIQLKTAKRRIKEADSKVDLILGDAQCLPIKPDSADLIACSEVIEHLPDPRAAIKQMTLS